MIGSLERPTCELSTYIKIMITMKNGHAFGFVLIGFIILGIAAFGIAQLLSASNPYYFIQFRSPMEEKDDFPWSEYLVLPHPDDFKQSYIDFDADNSCNEWKLKKTKKFSHRQLELNLDDERRRGLWFDGNVMGNAFCDDHHGLNESDPRIDRTCYFNHNSVCFDTRNEAWMFLPRTKIYDNLKMLNLKNQDYLSRMKDFGININMASHSDKSWETPIFWNFDQTGPFLNISNKSRIYYESNPSLLGIHARATENIGHILFDSYLSVLMTVDNWYQCGINKQTKINLILQDNRTSDFGQRFGLKLFDQIKTQHNLTQMSTDYDYICYKHFIVGTAQVPKLLNGLHQRQRMLKFMRNKILYNYGIDPFWKPHKHSINMLVFVKNSSGYNHYNWAKNMDTDVISWINEKYVNVQNPKLNKLSVINPSYTTLSFEQQLRVISKASIIFTQWGGISFSNFLAPFGSVEIIQTDAERDTLEEGHRIPDFEMGVRDSISFQTTLRYWDLTNSTRIEYIEKERLFRLIDAALDIVYANLL